MILTRVAGQWRDRVAGSYGYPLAFRVCGVDVAGASAVFSLTERVTGRIQVDRASCLVLPIGTSEGQVTWYPAPPDLAVPGDYYGLAELTLSSGHVERLGYGRLRVTPHRGVP